MKKDYDIENSDVKMMKKEYDHNNKHDKIIIGIIICMVGDTRPLSRWKWFDCARSKASIGAVECGEPLSHRNPTEIHWNPIEIHRNPIGIP